MLVTELRAVARLKINEKIVGGGNGIKYWQVASDALLELENRTTALEGITDEQFQKFLDQLSVSDSQDSVNLALSTIPLMSADDVIASLEQGTRDLNAETALRKARRDELMQIVNALGSIGARLLIAALVAA
jgi:hypothetical protein